MSSRLLLGAFMIAALVAGLATPAAAEEAPEDRDHIADRSWRFVVGAPAVRLNAYPMGWQVNGEMGVEFLDFNMIVATVSISDGMGAGGGLGYLYQHTFIRRYLYLHAGAFLGYWLAQERDSWDTEVFGFFSPTVRLIGGYRYVFLQVGFSLQIGTSAIPSFDIGIHVKV